MYSSAHGSQTFSAYLFYLSIYQFLRHSHCTICAQTLDSSTPTQIITHSFPKNKNKTHRTQYCNYVHTDFIAFRKYRLVFQF